MALVKGVREELQKKFNGLSDRRINQLIVDTQTKYGIINRDDAGYVLAFEKGIKLTKHLEPQEIQRIQDLIKSGPRVIQTVKPKLNNGKNQRQYVIKIGKEFDIDHPILPKRILDEAAKMAEIYPVIYAFENSVRNIVQSIMEKNHGNDWWDNRVGKKIRDKVAIRISDENKNKWHGKRSAHSIFYTDIEDLSDIIAANWEDFKQYFPDQAWVKTMISVIGTSRNVVAHNNPLDDDDIDGVKVNFRQWVKQIKDVNLE